MVGIFGHQNDAAEWLRRLGRLGEKHDRAGCFPDKTTRNIAEKLTEHRFLFQGAGHNEVDLIGPGSFENRGRRIAFLIMNGRVRREVEFAERRAKFFNRRGIPFPDVNEMQLPAKAIANPFCFGQYLQETGRKRARHGHSPIGWIDHLFAPTIFQTWPPSATRIGN